MRTKKNQQLYFKKIYEKDFFQVASRVLEIPSNDIYIAETNTDKVPNTTPTAASSGSDLNGMAVLVCTIHH